MTVNGYKLIDVRQKKIVECIKEKHFVKWLLAWGNTRYFRYSNPAQVKAYQESLLERENSIKETILSFTIENV